MDAALKSPAVVDRLLVTEQFASAPAWPIIAELAEKGDLQPEPITALQAEQLSDTRTPQGLFAVVAWPERHTPDLEPPILILDAISDPGNLGALLRTAGWFGLPSVWVSDDSADMTNPKAVRGGMGAHFQLANLYQGDIEALADGLKENGITLIGAVMGGEPLPNLTGVDSWALVMGNEARGLSPYWRTRLDRAVTIPGAGAAESLNVTVAAGIFLNHLAGLADKL